MQGDNLNADTLLSVIKRLESLDGERQGIVKDMKEVKSEAKENGFDLSVLNFILRERRKDPDDVQEFHRELSRYRGALENVEL
jgi:uncharacterized protein (UPF0335 family)